MRHRAFTLIELLVVIAILGVLMAMAFPLIGMFQKRALETRTRALMAKVSTAIEAYQQDRKRLPAWQGTWSNASWTWVEANNAMLRVELASTDNDHRGNPRPGYLVGELRPGDVLDGLVIDAWKKPLIYYTAAWPATTWPSGGPTAYVGNATSFELWSAGPDAAFEDLRWTAAATSDSDRDNLPARPYDPSLQK